MRRISPVLRMHEISIGQAMLACQAARSGRNKYHPPAFTSQFHDTLHPFGQSDGAILPTIIPITGDPHEENIDPVHPGDF
jgi:hypothetical protein